MYSSRGARWNCPQVLPDPVDGELLEGVIPRLFRLGNELIVIVHIKRQRPPLECVAAEQGCLYLLQQTFKLQLEDCLVKQLASLKGFVSH